MIKIYESLQDLQVKIDETFKELSQGFNKVNGAITQKNLPAAESALNDLFKAFMSRTRAINAQSASVGADIKKIESQCAEISAEKEQFKALYNSGIAMTTQGELQGLITFAMDQMTYHLRAERGFLILVDEHGEREYFVSKNFDGQNIDDPAAEVSTSVIQKTLDALQPIKVDDDTLSESIMKQGSFVRLGLRAVMSVPIIFRKKLLGVVYLDRREETKGFSDNDLAFLVAFSRQIAFRVNELKEKQHVHTEYERRDRNRLQSLREKYNFSEIIGKSERLVKVLELAGKVASSEVTVLIQGESGTGKELIARAIHFNSDRYEHKFIAINCGAIPSELLESELFGYESGAFTGAVKTKIGKFEAAHRGTLFLDEVAELSMNLQAKILRVLQTKELERLGSTETRKIDLRIISASNKNLQQMVREGKFREDLYYRLKVVEIELPALRERKEDIHLLVSFFVQKYGEQRIQSVSEDAMDILENYAWHGNIRELENVIQRAIILSSGTQIEVQDLPPEIVSKTESGYKVDKDLSLEDAETDFRRWFVLRALRKSNNNKSKAAEMLGINRTHFFRMLNQLGISDSE